MKTVKINNLSIGDGNPLVLVAGPCVIEDRETCLALAKRLKGIAQSLDIPFIFKASYDKANRSSMHSYRGPGLKKGLEILKEIKETVGVPVLSDVHSPEEAEKASKVLDILQIPAFLCRQTDLLIAAAQTGKPVNIKKGQFLAPWDMKYVAEKVSSRGNDQVILTERGTAFGYNNLVSDMRSVVIMKGLGYPVLYDATHSVQIPGGLGHASGGQREMVFPLARAAVAAGADGLFIEVHETPEKALSDSATMVPVDQLLPLLEQAKKIRTLLLPGQG